MDNNVGTEVSQFLHLVQERIEKGNFKDAMLYCRHANECMGLHKYKEVFGKKHDFRNDIFQRITNALRKNISNQAYESLHATNRLTREFMHYQENQSNIDEQNVVNVVSLIHSTFSDLFPDLNLQTLDKSPDELEISSKINANNSSVIRNLGFESDITQDTRIILQEFAKLNLDFTSLDSNAFTIDKIALGIALYHMGEIEQAETIFTNYLQQEKPDENHILCYRGLGKISRQRGLMKDAYYHYRKALDLSSDYNSQNDAIWIKCDLGDIERELGNLQKSEEMFSQSLKICDTMENQRGKCVALSSLGDVYRQRGDLDKAEDLHNQSLKISMDIDYFQRQSSNYGSLAEIARMKGDRKSALDFLDNSLEISRENGYSKGEAANLAQIAIMHRYDNPEIAKKYYSDSLDINEKIGHMKGVAACLGGLAFIARRNKNLKKARKLYLQCLDISTEIENKRGMGINLSELGLISLFEGKYDEAESFYEKSLKINQEIEYIRGIATCLGSLGNLATKRNDNKKAVEYYLESLEANEESGNTGGVSLTLHRLGQIHFETNDLDKAEEYYEKCRVLNCDIEDYKNASKAIAKLVKIAKIKGDHSKAKILEAERKRTWDLSNS